MSDPTPRPRRAAPRRGLRAAALTLAVSLASVSAGAAFADGTAPSEPVASPSPSVSVTPTTPPAPAFPKNGFTHVAVIFGENATQSTVEKGAPGLKALGRQYARATDFQALTNAASQKDYVGMVSGDVHTVKGNGHQISKDADILNAIASGGKRTAHVYRDGMGSDNCRMGNGSRSSKVVRRHDPWPTFTSTAAKRANCEKNDIAATALTGKGRADIPNGKLPNVGLVIPDNCQNGHDNCKEKTGPQLSKVKQFEKYALKRVAELQAGPQYKAGKLLIIVTYDEGSGSSENIIFYAIHPSLKGSNKVVTSSPDMTLYSLGALLAEVGQTSKLKSQKNAVSIAARFGLKAL